MRVLVKHPYHPVHAVHMPNTLEALQSMVGGYIETLTICSDLVLICNEEGFLKQMPYNCDLCGMTLVGPIILVGRDGEEFTDVPEDIVRQIMPNLFEEDKP